MSTSSRKDDHVRLAEELRAGVEALASPFDDLRFIHHALPGIGMDDVNAATRVCGRSWDMPFYINAMTGGSERTGTINAALADAAARAGVAIASGSEHAALADPSLEATFRTIREHTSGCVFANVGPTVSVSQARRAVELLDADALQIHLNAAQELVMPEGDRDFADWGDRVGDIVRGVDVPVVVKEVGFGMSARTIGQLRVLGVGVVDVSGRGGTNFIDIENRRRHRSDFAYLGTWGQSTPLCLLTAMNLPAPVAPSGSSAPTVSPAPVQLLASGGVRNPLDVVRALALGADAVGVSGHFLHTLLADGEQALCEEMEGWKTQLRTIMCLLGARSVTALRATDLLVTGRTREEAGLLGVDVSVLACRSQLADC